MVENNSYDENVKDFNRMLFKLDDKDFNWDMHTMIDLIVERIEAEYTMNCMLDDSNVIHINRFQDVLKWADYQKFISPGGQIAPIGYSGAAPKRRKQSKPIPTRRGFAIGRDGRRKRKKYL